MKSLGIGGLPLEFYWTFWDILAPELTVFKEFVGFDRLPDSFSLGVVTLLFEKGDKIIGDQENG